MYRDEEGFAYPYIDKISCINCKICESVCPELNVQKEKECKQYGYLVQIKNDKIRRESTSGGAFTAIAQYVIKKQGIVFGAAYNENFEVYHTYVECKAELSKFRNSKYVQSNMGDSYKKVKKFLNLNKIVLFSGTPCQIEGLKTYLKKDYFNLITIDVVCHAVPSPLIWEKYLDLQKKKYNNNIGDILFRDKYYGYKYSTMTIRKKDNRDIYNMGVETDQMLRAFFSDICDRPSCYKCSFKKRYRVSDFTIWDCFSVSDFDKKLDDDKGTTKVLIHTTKGKRIFDEIDDTIVWTEVDADKLVDGVKEMCFSVEGSHSMREEFFKDANIMDSKEFFYKYFPNNIKTKLQRIIRIICCKFGVYTLIKNLYKNLLVTRKE
jgi:coenzyme F420-reducing hydrogenase beta subunit